MRTLVTAITAVCSSRFTPGGRSAAEDSRTLRRRVSSYTGPGSSTGATATPGGNGARLALVDCGDGSMPMARVSLNDAGLAWDRANREALRGDT